MANPEHLFAVVLNSRVSSELLALVVDYLQVHDPHMKFLLCTDAAQNGNFLHCELVQNTTGKLWRIRIPVETVAAIVDLSKGQSPPGFLTASQKLIS